jgi:20S proteasome alpha/beta subunit
MYVGGSVIGLYYNNGIMIACDNIVSYGNCARYKNVERIAKINDYIAMASTGEYSDFTNVVDQL